MAVAPSVARLCAAQGEHQMSVYWTVGLQRGRSKYVCAGGDERFDEIDRIQFSGGTPTLCLPSCGASLPIQTLFYHHSTQSDTQHTKPQKLMDNHKRCDNFSLNCQLILNVSIMNVKYFSEVELLINSSAFQQINIVYAR